MAVINKRLLPIKAHYFFFMAAMGPILPQLSVLGKQIGVVPEVMGYITSILPVMYVLAKPLFGFVADYFAHFRKLIFIGLIMTMTLAYAAFYFIPQPHHSSIQFNGTKNMTFDLASLPICNQKLLINNNACSGAYKAQCQNDIFQFEAFFVDIFDPATLNYHNVTANYEKLSICLGESIFDNTSTTSVTMFSGTCNLENNVKSECFYKSATFWIFVILMCAGTIGFNVTNSISDAICFDVLGESEESKYGAQRVWGTIGFGVTALISGILVHYWTLGGVKNIVPALLIMLIFSGFDLLCVSTLKLPKLTASESIFKDVWQLIKQPPIAIFLLFATIAGIIDSFIIYFMFWHLEEVAHETGFGQQINLIEGFVVAAECLGGEVPFFFFSGKIIKKLGYVHCMSLCFFFYSMRLALISWIPNPWYLVGVEFFFQGCTYALCYTCIVAYASAVAPPGTSATVQGLMAGMDDGLGFSIGSLIGGLALKHFGGRKSFMYFAIVAICTCIAHILIRPSSRKLQYLPKASGYKLPTEQVAVALEPIKEELKA